MDGNGCDTPRHVGYLFPTCPHSSLNALRAYSLPTSESWSANKIMGTSPPPITNRPSRVDYLLGIPPLPDPPCHFWRYPRLLNQVLQTLISSTLLSVLFTTRPPTLLISTPPSLYMPLIPLPHTLGYCIPVNCSHIPLLHDSFLHIDTSALLPTQTSLYFTTPYWSKGILVDCTRHPFLQHHPPRKQLLRGLFFVPPSSIDHSWSSLPFPLLHRVAHTPTPLLPRKITSHLLLMAASSFHIFRDFVSPHA